MAKRVILGILLIQLWAGLALAGQQRIDFLALAQSGWIYDLDTARMRRPVGTPDLRLDSREVALGDICIFGEPPTPLSQTILSSFMDLLARIYDRPEGAAYAGSEITDCAPRQRMYLRLYSGPPPRVAFNEDLRFLDRTFDIRFPRGWQEPVTSPAEANGFFGRKGQTAHLLISQAPGEETPLSSAYHSSLLIEEIYQVISFGADVLKFDRETPFLSKLQEVPINLRYVPWSSEKFMTGLLDSNPRGLCGFDVFMLHALAESRLESTNSGALLTSIEANFDTLLALARETVMQPEVQTLLDPSCIDLSD